MEEWIAKLLELAVEQGIWALLYIYLFFRMLNDNKKREEGYVNTINHLSENIENGIREIQDKLETIT